MSWFTDRFFKRSARPTGGRTRSTFRNILTALSLLVCLAIIALMFRSSDRRDVLALPLGTHRAAWLWTTRDGLQFIYRTSSRPENHARGWSSINQPDGLLGRTWLGFGYFHTNGWYIRDYSGKHPISVKIVTIPDYPFILLTAILPAIWALNRLPPEPKCSRCGNALPVGAVVCPACKTSPVPQQK